MIKIQLTSVKYGMKLAKPVYTMEGKLLIDKGIFLRESYVYKLLNFGINEVFVEWDKNQHPPEFIEAITDEIKNKAKAVSGEVIENIRLAKEVNADEIKLLVGQIIDRLLNNKDTILYLTDIRTVDSYTFEHSLNVCLYALILGIASGHDSPKLESLGIGALLHDIGKLVTPDEILNKPTRLDDKEYQVIKQHVLDGHEMIMGIPDMNKEVALIVRDHHERYDGKGYPLGKKGKEIHEFARIVAICDVYDALTSDRAYKNKIPIHQAIEYLISMGNHQFDYALVKLFINQLAIYPEGTFVKLETGEIAEVIKENRQWPTRPLIAIIYDKQGQQLQQSVSMDLSKQLNIGISHAL